MPWWRTSRRCRTAPRHWPSVTRPLNRRREAGMNPKDGAVAVKAAPPAPRERHSAPALPNGRVTGGYVLKQLVADGLLATADAERFKISGGRDRAGHPLANLAEMNFRTPNAERKLLDLEMLTHWLAQKSSLPYF